MLGDVCWCFLGPHVWAHTSLFIILICGHTWRWNVCIYSYQSTLKQLFQEFESEKETSSQLASVTMRIMQALQTNLDGKSKQYKDPALTHLFLMNNIHYMVRSVRRFVSWLQNFQTSFWNIKSLSSMQIIVVLLMCCFQVWSQRFIGGWLGTKTPENCTTACKSVQEECLGKGIFCPYWTTSVDPNPLMICSICLWCTVS